MEAPEYLDLDEIDFSDDISYSVTSFKTIPELRRKCDSQNEDRADVRSLATAPTKSSIKGFGARQKNTEFNLSNSKPQYMQQFTEKPEKPLVTRHNDAGANEKMLDTFTAQMVTTSLKHNVLPNSETLSRMLQDRIYSEACCNS